MWNLKLFSMISANYCTQISSKSPKTLYKYLIRQCQKLPNDARKYYVHSIKQSFKQHINETDPERIEQIISRAYEDADWILKKYLKK